MLNRFKLINYLQTIQKREITNLASIVNSNIQTLRKITKNIKIIKKSIRILSHEVFQNRNYSIS